MPTDLKRPLCKNPTCKKQFTRPQGTNRLYCFDCRPERKLAYLPSANSQPVDRSDDDGPTLTDLTKKALDEGGVLETWQAVAAIRLAQLIDSGKHGASGAAGTIKAHREAMAVALADVGDSADVIDLIFQEA